MIKVISRRKLLVSAAGLALWVCAVPASAVMVSLSGFDPEPGNAVCSTVDYTVSRNLFTMTPITNHDILAGVPDYCDVRPYTAIPVPAAVWLIGSGLLGMVVVGRRRKMA